jgi:hypothetical protein
MIWRFCGMDLSDVIFAHSHPLLWQSGPQLNHPGNASHEPARCEE